MINEKYELYQIINDFIQKERIIKERGGFSLRKYYYYNINTINELKDGNIISWNSIGLKIYKKENNKSILDPIHEIEVKK